MEFVQSQNKFIISNSKNTVASMIVDAVKTKDSMTIWMTRVASMDPYNMSVDNE